MSGTSQPNSSDSLSHSLIATAIRRARKGVRRLRALFQSRVSAGFPSPADDHVETSLDLSRELIGKEEATFSVRVAGNSMTDADAPVSQSGVDTGRAVGASRPFVYLPDFLGQNRVFSGSLGRPTVLPCVVATGGDTQDSLAGR